jgi:hypothetical protein
MRKNIILLFSLICILNSGCTTATLPGDAGLASSMIGGVGAVSGYLLGKEIDDSNTSKLAGGAIGLVLAQQAFEMNKEADTRKVVEAYEQGKREARVEASNAYWRAVTGADGHEYVDPTEKTKTIHYRQIQYDPHVSQGVIYGASYSPAEMTIRGQ